MESANYKDDHLYFASESVGEGHPDKMCDQVSDAIVDACLKYDPNAKVAMETASKTGMVVLLGEMSVPVDKIPLEQIARQTLKQIGFISDGHGIDCDKCQVIINAHG
jgi:S-adenosylmethionine synthetase